MSIKYDILYVNIRIRKEQRRYKNENTAELMIFIKQF